MGARSEADIERGMKILMKADDIDIIVYVRELRELISCSINWVLEK